MLSVPKTQHEARTTDTKQQPALTKTFCSATAEEQTFPAAHYEKTYQPTVFTGMHARTCAFYPKLQPCFK